jgi:hypothetical protein
LNCRPAFSAQKKYFALKTKIFRSKQFFRAQNDFHALKVIFSLLKANFTRSRRFFSAQDDFHALNANFRLSAAIFTRSKQISSARHNFQRQSGIYHLPFTADR